MLKALVEEMNRYDEPAHKALEILNIYPEEYMEFNSELMINGELVPNEIIYPKYHWGHPMEDGQPVIITCRGNDKFENKRYEFTLAMVKSYDGSTITYDNGEGITAKLIKVTTKKGDSFKHVT